MRRIFSVLATFLIVGAALSAATGPALGQTDGAYTHTFTSGDGQYVIDVGDYSGQINVQMTTPEVPGSPNIVYATTLSGAQLDSGRIRLVNQGVYDNLTVTVSGPSTEPDWESGGIQVASSAYTLGSTGGDADMQCGNLESARSVAWTTVVDCSGYPGINEINTTNTDAEQVELDIYQDGLDQQAAVDNQFDYLNNYLNDTETTARIIGQNAYIRALNNGSSEATARTEATSAIRDYYAVKQMNLIDQWETHLNNGDYMDGVAANESGIDNEFAAELNSSDDSGNVDTEYVTYRSGSENLTLVNGTSASSPLLYGHVNFGYGSTGTHIGLTDGQTRFDPDGNTDYIVMDGANVWAPNSNYDNQSYLVFQRYADAWTEIEQQENTVTDEMDTIVNNTYSDYQDGEINNSDLVDPYTLSRRDAGDDYQSWAASMLTAIGSNSPETLENTGAFEIATAHGTYTGILYVSEEVTIEAGTTYNSSNLSGTEYVVTANETVELTGTWTVENITTTNGTAVQNATYQDTTYQAGNTSELIEQYENLLEERQEIEAREQNLQASGGATLLGTSQASLLVMMLLGGGVVYYTMREGDEV